jgi:pyrroloquinoline-quinone synthase
MVTTASYLNQIDEQIAARHLLTHPFYQAWTKGELAADALRDYAAQYYHHVKAFPTYLSGLHSHMDDVATRRQVLENLIDEEAGRPNHPELWLQFAESMGVDRATAESVELWEETKNLIATYRRICRDGSDAEGLAALYAYESQIPAIAESKIDGLVKHYGKDDPAAVEYFRVHVEADKEHSRVERELLATQLNDEQGPRATQAAGQALDALWEMLSGVCRRHAIAC